VDHGLAGFHLGQVEQAAALGLDLAERIPLMMHSTPIKRAAATVFIRCCATSVSTVGTPVMSMIATSEPVWTICSSRDSITPAYDSNRAPRWDR